MNTLFTIIVIVQVLSALTIIGLVLLQHGKGADMGAAFGSGASGSLFGATGSSNFLSKSTGVAAAVFFIATLTLAYLGGNRHAVVGGGVMDNLPVTPAKSTTTTAPATGANTVAPKGAVVPVAPGTPATPAPVTPVTPAAAGSTTGSVPAGQSGQIPK
ncbi:MAG: preprotein translocase subunit SecG [Herminiimonas sp.]|nr:preprotein translocase subunit SecG [Herminiimonas sp.]